MKALKNGFTLAEALIALAIVGVVAALTIPQLVHSTQKDQAGAVLGRAVEQIELGCQNMIQLANDNVDDVSYADNLLGITNPSFTPDALAPYIGTQKNTSGKYVFSKFPAEAEITAKSSVADPTDLQAEVATVKLDVNGFTKKPNSSGIDQFVFVLQNDGKLKPNDNVTKEVVKNGFKIK